MIAYISIVGFPFLNLTADEVAEMVENQVVPLRLKADITNEYDSGAIGVYREDERIGYVAKDSQKYVKDIL